MHDLTPELLARLEEYAKAATPGPWCLNGGTAAIAATYGRQKIFCTHVGGTYPAADAKHIAAASPDVVLALVTDARKLAAIRALLAVEDDGPEGAMGPRWILGQIKEVLNGGT